MISARRVRHEDHFSSSTLELPRFNGRLIVQNSLHKSAQQPDQKLNAGETNKP